MIPASLSPTKIRYMISYMSISKSFFYFVINCDTSKTYNSLFPVAGGGCVFYLSHKPSIFN